MARTKLTATGSFEEALLKYVEENASDVLVEKINGSEKTIKECAGYIISEARKKQHNQCTVMSDAEVYGLAIHYFEEDSIKASGWSTNTAKVEQSDKPKKAAESSKKNDKHKAAKKNEFNGQISLFDMMGDE